MLISSRDVQSGYSAASAKDEMELVGGGMITFQNLFNQSTRLGSGADEGCWNMKGGPPNVEATTRAW